MVGPAEEEIRDDGDWWGRVRSEPLDDGLVEVGHGLHHGEEASGREVLDVLNALGDGGAFWEGEN